MGKRNNHAFWLGFGVTLSLLVAGTGLLAVDYQGRRLSFGDAAPPLAVDRLPDGTTQLTVKAFGVEEEVDITAVDQAVNFLWDFACLPRGGGEEP